MRRQRTTARGILLLALAALLVTAGTAAAHAVKPGSKVPRLVFPLLGPATFTDDFGDARGQGSHDGNDLMAPWRALVLAAEAGTVKFWTTSARAGCMLYLHGESGTTYLYVHLNNDLTDGNDNRGKCVPGIAYADGLRSGAKVRAGQVVAYNGDSGDADGIDPHLHFEVHPGGGKAVDPLPHLKKARRLLFAAEPGSTFTLALTGKVVEAAGEELSLALDTVRSWPGGRKLEQSGRRIGVSVPPSASIEGLAGPVTLSTGTLELVEPGTSVTVFTAPAKATLAAQSGVRNALAAKRVLVRK
jgi:hypothetical protein